MIVQSDDFFRRLPAPVEQNGVGLHGTDTVRLNQGLNADNKIRSSNDQRKRIGAVSGYIVLQFGFGFGFEFAHLKAFALQDANQRG